MSVPSVLPTPFDTGRTLLRALALALLCAGAARAAQPAIPFGSAIDELLPELVKGYEDLHRNPELSAHEEKTARTLATRLTALGYEVTSGVGGTGVVGVLRNGTGPTVLLRTDLDALPVQEKTGLAYASTATARDDGGAMVSVMHACGHDIHMTCWLGTAALFARARDRWQGTLVLIGQPAEETGSGARAMIADGVLERFPKPDFAVAIHDSADLPSGRVGYTSGFALANVDSVDVTIHGVGGHGAYPHTTVDPIVIAARTVVALQTIVSRENNPLDPAVVTVGSIHGGTKHNIVPDEVRLQITVRSYKPEVREHLLAAIRRIVKAEAEAAGAPSAPTVTISEGTSATYNDPTLTQRAAAALRRALGDERVAEMQPVMGGEDFSAIGLAGIPSAIFWVGAVEPAKYARAKAAKESLPSLHSPFFAPDAAPTIRTGVLAESAILLDLLGRH